VLRAVYHVHKTDAITKDAVDGEHDTELTKLAERAVEIGVNEITGGQENRDDDFSVKKATKTSDVNQVRNVARKKKKAQRQNRKKKR
jgi:uncharacterized NAD-dependent epimerase/dehydratase family protein